MCLPSTTQHNFSFFEIRIFENYMFEQILKLTKMYLFWKRCVWEKIVKEEICCARRAQISTTFLFSKFAFFKIICLHKFWNWQKCIYFEKDASERKLLRKRFVVLAEHKSARLFFFRNSPFSKLYVCTNFEIDKNVFILKRMRLRDNC